jgi:thioredoxin-like negative regulator of GroEL
MVDTFTRLSGTRLSGTRLSGTRPSRRAGLTVIGCLAAGLALPHGRPGAAEPQAACLADPTAACIFALAEDLARLQTPPERHIVAVAVAWAKAGDFARAATVIDSLQPFAPSHDDALRRMASVAASQNRDETLASILAEIRNERTREQARAEAAVAFARAGHLDAAQSLLTTLSFPSDRATVLAEIGLAEERAGRSNEAMAAFSAAEEAITQGEVAKSALGTALARAGHIDRALAISETLVAGTPLYALQVAIVSSLLEADRIPQALDVIDGIPNAGIREAARLKILAFLLEAGRDGEADALAATFTDGMGSPRVLLAYARALARRGDDDGAIAMIGDLEPKSRSPVYYAIARRQIAEGDLAGARSSLDAVSNGRQRQDLLRLIALDEAAAGSRRQALETVLSIDLDQPRLTALLDLAVSLAPAP